MIAGQVPQKIRPIHPFPARMAPDLAIEVLSKLPPGAQVLDPMTGSGTVLRHAVSSGHFAVGRDLDPLAVLMARVWNTPCDKNEFAACYKNIIDRARAIKPGQKLKWIDDDEETHNFVNYWFATTQQRELRRIACALNAPKAANSPDIPYIDIMKVALSRIIITKEQCASLARDTSHSRPHRVALDSDYDVWAGFERSVDYVMKILDGIQTHGFAQVSQGDARSLDIPNESIDLVLTSPPYLNAIDYMRGHRMSLVWLGYKLSSLREIRSTAIGTERAPGHDHSASLFNDIFDSMTAEQNIGTRDAMMMMRYAEDMYRIMSEISRVLRRTGQAILVVGNSCIKGNYVNNANGIVCAGRMVGLKLLNSTIRDLPSQHRYLPMPKESNSALGKRMRTESILVFSH